MEAANPDNPALDKMTPTSCASEFKRMIFAVFNSLTVEHFQPGDKVII